MAKQSEEAKLRRRKMENRRGVFASWGYPTWESILLGGTGDREVAASLASCKGVGDVERDVTADVLSGSWEPPLGEYALLVTPTVTEWSYLVTQLRDDEVRKYLRKDYSGRMLSTGYQDTAGVVYVNVWEGDRQILEFYTDGTPWESDGNDDEESDESEGGVAIGDGSAATHHDVEDDFESLEFTRFVADEYPADWLNQWASAEQAHQEAIRLFDAYVPGLSYEEDSHALSAAYGHEAAVSSSYIKRIDLVRFGKTPKSEPSRQNVAAGRRLKKAVEEADLAGVQKALAQNATLGLLPDSYCSALWLACYNLCYGDDDTEAIINALLDAGADPNLLPRDDTEHAVERLIANDRDNASTPRVLKRLAEAGAELNSKSPHMMCEGDRPLHRAAKRARPKLVAALLALGADPYAGGKDGHTPRESVDVLLADKGSYLSPAELAEEREDYREVIELLEAAMKSKSPSQRAVDQ